METRPPFDGLIIGSGIGGLSAGIILSLLRYRVAIVERNPLPGGLMRGYRRGGVDLPVGVHYFGSFGEGESLRRMCDYLGLSGNIDVERMGCAGPIDRYLFEDFTFDLPSGIDAFVAALERAFPDDRCSIGVIAGNLRKLSVLQNSFALFSREPMVVDPSLFSPLGEYLDRMKCSSRLRAVLSVSARWLGMSEEECPALYHHLALTSYLISSWRLRGSGADLADTFASRFESLGGNLLCGDPVAGIIASKGVVEGVRLASGREFRAPLIVAAIHPKKVIGMLPEGVVQHRRTRRIAELAETESLFALHATLDAGAHPALPYNLFRLQTDHRGALLNGVFCQLLKGVEGRNLLVVMKRSPYSEWNRWENTKTGRRGREYEQHKADMAGKLLKDAGEILGPLAGARLLDAYTPLTIRDWVDTPEGSPYGIIRSLRQLPVAGSLHRLGLAGLFFAGQSALSPGILGTMLGSFQAVKNAIGPDRFASEVFPRLHTASMKGLP